MIETLPALDDQRDRDLIRDALDATLVVEAAAGTGKTTELVARIVQLVATGRATVDQIVAVTFTEKAAGELKLRVREELDRARMPAAPPAAAEDVKARLDQALARLEESHISTIHGFCADLLRERPVETRVDPGFTVLVETQASHLFDQAFREWLQEQLERPSEGVRRALRRKPAWSPETDDEDGPVERLRRAGLALLEWRDFRAAWRRDPFDRDADVRHLAEEVCTFADHTAHPSWRDDPLFKGTEPARVLADEIRAAQAEGTEDLDGLEAALVRLSASRDFKDVRRRTGRKPDYGGGVTRAQLLDAYDRLAESLSAFKVRANADLAAVLQQELLACVDRYDALKTGIGALDFLDLLLRARDLVRDGAVRRAFQQRFRYILVDEFQDTDPLQAEILVLLAGQEEEDMQPDWRQLPVRPGALFVVGDPKQSIYRFRRADVGVYQEVCDLLVDCHGAQRVHLRTSFRAVPDIQWAINAAFAPAMLRDPVAQQADYVALAPWRGDLPLETVRGARLQQDQSPHPAAGSVQPAVVALPVPDPYGRRSVSAHAIEASLPDAVGAFVHWLVTVSGWTVVERRPGSADGSSPFERREWARVPIEPRHVCILFRRFVKYQDDVTRAYVQALEARGLPHLLVGGRSFHNREEVETLRAALAAVEWPDDQLSVYATLRGGLFALGDAALLEYWNGHPRRRFHPFDVPEALADHLKPIGETLTFLRELHIRRNYRPVPETIARLLEHTRAHVAFVMRPAGEQVLANVLQVAELARQYEADDGISFRGFVEELRRAAERSDAPEAPVVEEGSEGVRLMTVHKAKGLEFPVVVLADITCRLNRDQPGRHVDPARGLCAVPLAGCVPRDLLDYEALEVARDAAEGVRLAYVAATRARDLLVVPAVGDSEYAGWAATLNAAIYPPVERRRDPAPARGCPPFRRDSVRTRPDGDPARADTVRPGLYVMPAASASESAPKPGGRSLEPESGRESGARSPKPEYSVIWWDPHALTLDVQPPFGVRREDLIAKDAPPAVVTAARSTYDTWRNDVLEAVALGSIPSVHVRTITEWAHSGEWPAGVTELPTVEVIELPRTGARPKGRRFGTLVHAVLATAPLDATREVVRAMAALEGRLLAAPEDEVTAAADLALAVLAHDLLVQARSAHARGACRREVPMTLTLADGRLLEGIVDLAFERDGAWTVVDFKTDENPLPALDVYRRQVGLYATAISRIAPEGARGILVIV